MSTLSVTIPKEINKGKKELIVVCRREFEAFQKWQAEAQNALAKVKRGREEYRQKTTIVASSPRIFR